MKLPTADQLHLFWLKTAPLYLGWALAAGFWIYTARYLPAMPPVMGTLAVAIGLYGAGYSMDDPRDKPMVTRWVIASAVVFALVGRMIFGAP